MPWYELVNMLIGVGIGWASMLFVAWTLGWWRRVLHVGPLLEKMAEDESTLLRYEPNTPEPPPVPNDGTPIQDLVIADMEERKRIGIKKYGTPLQAHNGRDALVDAYQEILDTAVYLRQRIEEGCCHEPHRIFIQDKLVQINADGTAEAVEDA